MCRSGRRYRSAMSEFSDSYHLVTDAQADGIALLERAGLGGWVFPPGNGWCMVVVAGQFAGAADARILQANEGVLLYYLNAEDHGWGFAVWSGTEEVGSYGIEWTEDIGVEDRDLHLDALHEALTPVPASAWPAIDAELTTTPDESAIFGATGNPGHRVAGLLGLERVEWMSGAALEHDPDLAGVPGVVSVDGEPVGIPSIAEMLEQRERFEREHGMTDEPPDLP